MGTEVLSRRLESMKEMQIELEASIREMEAHLAQIHQQIEKRETERKKLEQQKQVEELKLQTKRKELEDAKELQNKVIQEENEAFGLGTCLFRYIFLFFTVSNSPVFVSLVTQIQELIERPLELDIQKTLVCHLGFGPNTEVFILFFWY